VRASTVLPVTVLVPVELARTGTGPTGRSGTRTYRY
jgi:hypothetical protein